MCLNNERFTIDIFLWDMDFQHRIAVGWVYDLKPASGNDSLPE